MYGEKVLVKFIILLIHYFNKKLAEVSSESQNVFARHPGWGQHRRAMKQLASAEVRTHSSSS